MTTRLDILLELLEATPMPPLSAEIDALLRAFDAMHARRDEILGRLRSSSGPRRTLDETEISIASTLEARQALWMTQLAEAKQATSDQRIGATKLRAYAPSLSGP